MQGMLEWKYARILLVLLVVMMNGTILLEMNTSKAAFAPSNHDWDGVSGIRDQATSVGADYEVVYGTSEYNSIQPERTLVLILSPESSYGPAEAARLRSFVREGGTVLIADDFGPHANDLAVRLGANARFDGRLLRDERKFYRAPVMPRVQNASANTFQNTTVTLNNGTVIQPNGARVLFRSSSFSWLDGNFNGRLDADETPRPYPVATIEQVGEGQVMLMSDPSIFINAMLSNSRIQGNERFARNLFARYDRVVLGYSHAKINSLGAFAIQVVRKSTTLQFVFGALVVGLVGFTFRVVPAVIGRDQSSGVTESATRTEPTEGLNYYENESRYDE